MSAFTLSNVYNNFLTAYVPKSSRYDTHKKDELKSVYRRIVKESEDAPLFLMDRSGESQKYALSLKEDARDLKNAISSLSSDYSSSVLDKKIAASSDKDIVDAKYIGKDDTIDSAPTFEMEVKQLASSQVNIGKFLPNRGMALEPDNYSFDIHVNDTDYEFQFGSLMRAYRACGLDMGAIDVISNVGLMLRTVRKDESVGVASVSFRENTPFGTKVVPLSDPTMRMNLYALYRKASEKSAAIADLVARVRDALASGERENP